MKKQFLQQTAAPARDGSVGSALRKSTFASDAADEVLTHWRDKELRSPPFVLSLDEAPLARLGLDESDTGSEGKVEAQKIWRDMEIRKYGFGGGGSIGWVKFSTGVNRNSGAGMERRVAVLEARVRSGLGMLD